MPKGDVTAAPEPLRMGGEELRCSPLTDRDMCELDKWLQHRIIQMARDSLSAGATELERADTMDAAVRQASTASWLSPSGAKLMANPDGMSRIIWQMAHRNHPGLTHERVREMMMADPRSNIEEANRLFEKLNTAGTSPPKNVHRRRGK